MAPSLATAIQNRITELREEYIPAYQLIGRAGWFTLTTVKQAMLNAEQAIAAADTVQMARSLQELRGFKL